MTKSLEDFLIDTEEVNRERLAEVLDPYLIGIDKDKGAVILNTKNLQNLSSVNKVLCFLLAIKAAFLLDKRKNDQASWKEVCEATGMPGGTVRPVLGQLKEAGMLSGESGNYNVPNHVLHLINFDEKLVSQNAKDRPSKRKSANQTGVEKRPGTLELDSTSFQPYIEHLSRPGFYLERSLLVLKLARDAGKDGLSPNDIESILTEFVRQPISNKNISYALGKKGKAALYTMRSKNGKAYVYRLTPQGEKVIEEFINKKVKN